MVESEMTVRMLTLPTLTSFKMEPFGRITGTRGDYRLTLRSGQSLKSGTKLKVEIPRELTLPNTFNCVAVSANLE